MRYDELDESNPYRYDPSAATNPRSQDRFSGLDRVAFDDSDHRWAWVRTGLLLLMFGYFCVPFFIVATVFALKMNDVDLMKQITLIGLAGTMGPIAIGWLLCARTPPEVGTSRKALLAGIGTLIQVWTALGRIWPDVVPVPAVFISLRTVISVMTLALMLRYLQDTFEYLKPGESDRWVISLRKITNWLAVAVLLAVGVMVVARGKLPMIVVVPFLTGLAIGALATFVLFYGSLFRLWVLLRGEGQFIIDDFEDR